MRLTDAVVRSRGFPLIAAVLIACVGVPRVGSAQSTCHPQDGNTTTLYQWAKEVATGTDSLSAVNRQAFSIPSTSASKVSIVTSASTCNAAGNAVSLALGSSPTDGRAVHVVKVDKVYVVSDPVERVGGFGRSFVFDSKWRLLERILD